MTAKYAAPYAALHFLAATGNSSSNTFSCIFRAVVVEADMSLRDRAAPDSVTSLSRRLIKVPILTRRGYT